ncbi:MAG TPA: NAD(P)/FAD-dependent oxidoreductase [Acidiphilium sp.]
MDAASPQPALAVTIWLDRFGSALVQADIAAVTALFADPCYWRDLVAFTWNIRTLEGRDDIAAMLGAVLAATGPTNFVPQGEASEKNGVTEGWFTFETAVARGQGHVRLKDGRAWTLLTAMTELKGFEEPRGTARAMGAEHGVHPGRENWADRRRRERAAFGVTVQPYVLIVGGGQGGIALGARLKRLGVPALIVEKNARAGDSWRNRYRSLCLHDPVWYDHMPYLPFPDHWPVFTPKDKMGDWLEAYVSIMELDYRTSTEVISARHDDEAGEWTVDLRCGDESLTLRPKHLVLATGMSGVPNLPEYPGMASFTGTQHHSSAHKGGEGWTGKRAVVIGSNNSAHDICADLWENGATVTMVQRSSTHVSRSETLMEFGLGPLYSETALARGITTEKADMISASVPYALVAEWQKPVAAEIHRRDADLHDRLRKAGFMLDMGDDGTGLALKYLRRGSGYYIDVGASELIADGRIGLKSGVTVTEIKPHSVALSDGSELPADLIVYATGYGSMNGWAERLISREVADTVGKCWGYGSNTTKDPGPWEGEQRNMWKPTQQDGLWFQGGNLHQSRHFSLYLALQLKARLEGVAGTVYGLQEVFHTA